MRFLMESFLWKMKSGPVCSWCCSWSGYWSRSSLMVWALALRQGRVYDEYWRASGHSSSSGTSRTDAKEARCGLWLGGGSCNWEARSLAVGKVAAIVESL